MKLKLLTINLHCFAENDVANKQLILVDEIVNKNADIVFLQEVAQTNKLDIIKSNIKKDNYGLTLQSLLEEKGIHYFYYYDPIKMGYGIYDEGVGILSKYILKNEISHHISKCLDYQSWKTRKVLAYDLEDFSVRVATTHFGWSDGYELFEDQFKIANDVLRDKNLVILAGDFNIEYGSKEYQNIIALGWVDVFDGNPEYEKAVTFKSDNVNDTKDSRIDYIMTNKPVQLIDQEIVFIEKRVSDHFGVYVEIEL